MRCQNPQLPILDTVKHKVMHLFSFCRFISKKCICLSKTKKKKKVVCVTCSLCTTSYQTTMVGNGQTYAEKRAFIVVSVSVLFKSTETDVHLHTSNPSEINT